MKRLILAVLLLTGCSNANWAAMNAWGKRHDVKCWSGGTLILDTYTDAHIVEDISDQLNNAMDRIRELE